MRGKQEWGENAGQSPPLKHVGGWRSSYKSESGVDTTDSTELWLLPGNAEGEEHRYDRGITVVERGRPHGGTPERNPGLRGVLAEYRGRQR